MSRNHGHTLRKIKVRRDTCVVCPLLVDIRSLKLDDHAKEGALQCEVI